MSAPYFLLDGVTGWRDISRTGLTLTRPGLAFTLEPLPGDTRLYLDAALPARELRCPSALSSDPCEGLVVVDAALHEVKKQGLGGAGCLPDGRKQEARGLESLPAVGGAGSEARRFRQPRGVALLPSGGLVVADTGNHRVQVFSPPPYALSQVWGAQDADGNPAPGSARLEFRHPWAVVVDGKDIVHVVDRGNRRVQRIQLDGTWIDEFGAGFLVDPVRIARGPHGSIAIVDRGVPGVFLLRPGEETPVKLASPAQPRSAAFDTRGWLYVGDDIGLVHVFKRDADAPGGYRRIGAGVTGVDGEVIDLEWHQGLLLAILREDVDNKRQRIWQMTPGAAHMLEGSLVVGPLDSGIERCVWHRVLLDAGVPKGTSLTIESFTSEDAGVDVSDPAFTGWKSCLVASDSDPDCLIQSPPGQGLWLRLTFKSNGLASPELRSLKAYFPRVSYLQYLPAGYQEDEESRLFLDRFLSLFQTDVDNLDKRIDGLWLELLSPYAAPPEHLSWLSAWLALVVNPEWPLPKKRQMLADAFPLYGRRGTPDGLEQAIKDYTGVVSAQVLEHFRLRRWPDLLGEQRLCEEIRLWSRNFYARLQTTSYSQVGMFRLTSVPEPGVEPFEWGAHRFTVFFPAHPHCVEETTREVAKVVEREKPAHTEATLCAVLPRLRVGVQAAVGVDTLLASIDPMVLNRTSRLSYDTILGCSLPALRARALGAERVPRAGLTTRLQ